jgi:hypothetical protein
MPNENEDRPFINVSAPAGSHDSVEQALMVEFPKFEIRVVDAPADAEYEVLDCFIPTAMAAIDVRTKLDVTTAGILHRAKWILDKFTAERV